MSASVSDDALSLGALPRRAGRTSDLRGRPRKKGRHLSKLNEILLDRRTRWRQVKVNFWYGREERMLLVATGTAVWYHSGMPVVPLRWVLVRDPLGKLGPKALFERLIGTLAYAA